MKQTRLLSEFSRPSKFTRLYSISSQFLNVKEVSLITVFLHLFVLDPNCCLFVCYLSFWIYIKVSLKDFKISLFSLDEFNLVKGDLINQFYFFNVQTSFQCEQRPNVIMVQLTKCVNSVIVAGIQGLTMHYFLKQY